MSKDFLVILTGGTIEAIDIKVKYKKLSDNPIGFYLDSLNLHRSYDIRRMSSKDSREFSDRDRELFLEEIEKSDINKILVVHGTITMVETAKYFEKHKNRIKNKTVVLTGSITPFHGYWWSDAPFNLGFAISTLFTKKSGIYIAMNGRVFTPDNVRKNVKEVFFESIKD